MVQSIVWVATMVFGVTYVLLPRLLRDPSRRRDALFVLNMVWFALLGVTVVVFPPHPVGRLLTGSVMVAVFLLLLVELRRRTRRGR